MAVFLPCRRRVRGLSASPLPSRSQMASKNADTPSTSPRQPDCQTDLRTLSRGQWGERVEVDGQPHRGIANAGIRVPVGRQAGDDRGAHGSVHRRFVGVLALAQLRRAAPAAENLAGLPHRGIRQSVTAGRAAITRIDGAHATFTLALAGTGTKPRSRGTSRRPKRPGCKGFVMKYSPAGNGC